MKVMCSSEDGLDANPDNQLNPASKLPVLPEQNF